ncbi:MAG: hypothetical protein ACYC7L_13315 [Nitrospirota bacterium]
MKRLLLPGALDVAAYRTEERAQGIIANAEKKLKKCTEVFKMAKKSRGGRMTAAKVRAAKKPGGKGPVKDRPAGKHIMKT